MLFLLIWLTPALAAAADDLQRAMQLFWEMEYDQAIEQAEEILKSPDNQPRDLVRAYYIQGLCLSATGRTREAVQAYRKLLSIDPAFTLDSTISPSLSPPFKRARVLAARQSPITLNHQRPESPGTLAGLKLTVSLEADPLGLVKAIRLKYQRDDRLEVQSRLAFVSGPGITFVALPANLAATQIRYHLEAINQYGGVLARAGGPDDWFLVRLKAPPEKQVPEDQPPPKPVAPSRPEAPPGDEKTSPAGGQRLEIELHGCLLGNEFIGEQGKGTGSSGIDRINLGDSPPIRARIGMGRWGAGLKFGFRPAERHLVFAQVDYLWEEWIGTISPEGGSEPLHWVSHFNLLRLLAGYRFHYPVTRWLAPYAELGAGTHVYLPSTIRLRDQNTGDVLLQQDINAGSRFALMLGLGLRFQFHELFFANVSYLWDIPILELSSSSFVIGAGATF